MCCLYRAFLEKSTDPDAICNWSTNWAKGLVERSGIKITPQLPVRTDGWIRDVANFAQTRIYFFTTPS
jgi:hypothetical protein